MDTNTAFLAYGIHIGSDAQETERINAHLPAAKDQCPDVHTAVGGSCLGEEVFLVTYSHQVESGSHRGAGGISAKRQADWNTQLAHAIQTLGYNGLQQPAWLCFTELS